MDLVGERNKIFISEKNPILVDLSEVEMDGIELKPSFIRNLKSTIKRAIITKTEIRFIDKSDISLCERLFKKWAIEDIIRDYNELQYSYRVFFRSFEEKAMEAFTIGEFQIV